MNPLWGLCVCRARGQYSFSHFLLLSVLKMASARQKNIFVIALSVQCSSQAFLSVTVVAGVVPSAQLYHSFCCVNTEWTGSENSFWSNFLFWLDYFPQFCLAMYCCVDSDEGVVGTNWTRRKLDRMSATAQEVLVWVLLRSAKMKSSLGFFRSSMEIISLQ